jgi:hypothetical protein
MLTAILIGCTGPTDTAIIPTTFHQIPTQIPTLTPNPTPTSIQISNFEQCVTSLGSWLLEGYYPRQCVTESGKIFTEELKEVKEDGIIYDKTYGGKTSDEIGRYITSTQDGGYLIIGEVGYGCWVRKVDAEGEEEWDSYFDQELFEELKFSTSGYRCLLARQTPVGSYVILGQGYEDFSSVEKPFFTFTLDHEGNLLSGDVIAKKAGKISYLDQEGNLIRLTALGIPGGITETLDGGYAIVSNDPGNDTGSTIHLTKTDKRGAYIWDRNLCKDNNIQQTGEAEIVCSYNVGLDVIQLHDGSFVIIVNFVIIGKGKGAWLLKTDVAGNVEWLKTYSSESGGSVSGYDLVALPDSGYLTLGNHNGGTLTKMDDDGNIEWSRTYTGGFFTKLEQGPNGEIAIMGSKSFAGSFDLWLLTIDTTVIK